MTPTPARRAGRARRARLRLPAALWLALALPLARAQDAAPAEPAADAAHPYLDLRRQLAPPGDAAAGREKAQLCATCHGPTGATSVAPMIPNLAGQRPSYLYWELIEYKRGTLAESPMTVLTADIGEQDIRDLAAFYASQRPEPQPADTPAASAEVLARGRRLYLHGDPGRGIPPCQGCHGAEARGHPLSGLADSQGHQPYAAYPVLRGQRGAYLQSRLTGFHEHKLHDSTTDFVMSGVGERLDPDSIEALSAWLSSLPP